MLARHKPAGNKTTSETQKYLYVFLGVFLAGVGIITVKCLPRRAFEMVVIGYSWMALFYTLLLLIAVSEKTGPVRSVVRWAPLRSLGVMAYGVYLFREFPLGVESEDR